ncbi:RNAse Z [Flavobacteriaceae bacterium MAR_2010_188]|nr:RNAse Z [Flavobacteriaceae bacterium MAR_2010_188]
MKLTILGCHSATPRTHRNPTSQVLEIRNHIFLIDCGEGTQVELRRNKIKFSRIKHIFISHLHGDHYFGLIGLISTFQLLSRKDELHIYGPKGLKEVITLQVKLANSWTAYDLRFHILDQKIPELIFEDETLTVNTIPLNHRVYTNGFLFREKPGERKLDYRKAVDMEIEMPYFRKLKIGDDVPNRNGEMIKNDMVTSEPNPTKSYAFCSDTGYMPTICDQIKSVDVLYHESTFLEKNSNLAESTKHSTAKQAAQIARVAEAKLLILGHFSTRYDDLEEFALEAQEIFENTELAADGKSFTFN